MQLTQALDIFLSTHHAHTTQKWYKRMCGSLIAHIAAGGPLEAIPLTALTENTLRQWRDWLTAKPAEWGDSHAKHSNGRLLSAHTINSHLRAVKVFCNWLTANGHTSAPLGHNLRYIRTQRQRIRYVNDSDRDRVFHAAIANTRDYLIARMLASTGCRIAGLVSMRVSDFEFRPQNGRRWLPYRNLNINDGNRCQWRGRVLVKEKGEKVRLVYFGPETAAAFFDYLESRHHASEFLFMGRQGPLTDWGIRRALNQIAKIAKVEGATNPHAWRHGFAKGMIKRGADLKSVSELMGHSSIHITAAIYLDFTDEELDSQHEKYAWAN